MPVNWSDPSDVQQFRQAALDKGASAADLDAYIATKSAEAPAQMPETPALETTPAPVAQDPLVEQSLLPQTTSLALETPQTLPPTPFKSEVTAQAPLLPPAQPPETDTVPQVATQSGIVSTEPIMGTQFGVRQSADRYSHGINYGTDVIVPKGTKAAVPPEGEWKVVEAFGQAVAEGPHNRQGGINRGYGNSILVENTQTGEKLRYSHLTPGGVLVKPGETVPGGEVIGVTGATGNTAGRTGQHLDLEYYAPNGKIANVMRSPYGKYVAGGR